MRWMGRYAGYNAEKFRKDVIAGFIVGIVAIPLGMGFAIAVGVKPEYGLYTTIIAGILISLFGGSKYQIGGPTGAFIPILLAIVIQYGYENLLIAGLLAGIILLAMGLLRLGSLIHYVPKPVMIGFTSGIAVIIFTGQIPNALGLTGLEKHEYFLDNMREIAVHIPFIEGKSVIIAAVCFLAIFLTERFFPKIPSSLAGLIIATGFASLAFGGEVATIQSAFGAIPSALPTFQWLDMTWEKVAMMLGPALTIAMLGGIESLLSAAVADDMTGDRHNSNRELIGQGIANIITPFFGGIPATGAIARTATNIKSGAVSPISGVVHGIVVCIVLMLFAPYASHIPLAAMAPILMMVAWNMSERKSFAAVLRTKSSDSLVMVTTFALTVFTNVTIAVISGILLAVIFFIARIRVTVRETATTADVVVYEIEGPLFFGAANHFEEMVMDKMHSGKKVLLFHMHKVPYLDTTGETKLSSIIKKVMKNGGTVLLSGVQSQPMEVLRRTQLIRLIGEENIFENPDEAMREVSR